MRISESSPRNLKVNGKRKTRSKPWKRLVPLPTMAHGGSVRANCRRGQPEESQAAGLGCCVALVPTLATCSNALLRRPLSKAVAPAPGDGGGAAFVTGHPATHRDLPGQRRLLLFGAADGDGCGRVPGFRLSC